MKRTWKLLVIHYVAKALGVLVKVDGLPHGSIRNLPHVRGGACVLRRDLDLHE